MLLAESEDKVKLNFKQGTVEILLDGVSQTIRYTPAKFRELRKVIRKELGNNYPSTREVVMGYLRSGGQTSPDIEFLFWALLVGVKHAYTNRKGQLSISETKVDQWFEDLGFTELENAIMTALALGYPELKNALAGSEDDEEASDEETPKEAFLESVNG